jgi:hypothetical protein
MMSGGIERGEGLVREKNISEGVVPCSGLSAPKNVLIIIIIHIT